MKKVIIVVDNLVTGGVSKVLINFLNKYDRNIINIDLLVLHYTGQMKHMVPKDVKVIEGTKFFEVIDSRIEDLIKERNIIKILKKIRMSILIMTGLIKYKIIKERKKILSHQYENEISFNDGFCTLFVGFGNSKNKINWNHIEVSCKNTSNRYFKTMSKALKNIDCNVSVSDDAGRAFYNYYKLDKIPLTIINIIDDLEIIEKSKEKIDFNLDKNILNIVSVGRLDHQKGYDRYLEIHKRLIDEGFKFRLYIIGNGNQKDILQKSIIENRLENSIILMGEKMNPFPYVKACDLTLLVSRFEGMPTVIFESLILNRPVISTKVSGINYLLKNGKYGIIMENSENGIYQGMKRLLSNTDLIKKYESNLVNYKQDNQQSLDKIYDLLK